MPLTERLLRTSGCFIGGAVVIWGEHLVMGDAVRASDQLIAAREALTRLLAVTSQTAETKDAIAFARMTLKDNQS